MMNRQPVATASNYYQPHATNFHQQQQQYNVPVASLVYRPLQLPVQHPHEAASPSPDHQQTQLSLAAYRQHQHQHQRQQQQVQQVQIQQTEFNFRHPHQIIHHQHQHEAGQHCARADSRQHSRVMSYPGDEDLAAMQKASAEYEPEVTGPLVGQRQPSTAITTEYASADPIYQAKTAALPQKYSHYRTVRGDGKCGWRAVAFGYFEALINLADVNKLGMEQARIRSLNNVMTQAGYSMSLMEDFVEETLNLLREITSAVIEGHDAASILLDKFNDELVQNYIISHLRALTAAWMKTHEADYAPWVSDSTIDQYCTSFILPVGAEIDHVGLTALKDVFISPSGMALEVLYLDRSEGNEVTMHRFDPPGRNGYAIGSVRLLYRPGHYDLLYKLEDLPASVSQIAVPTYLQFASQPNESVYDLGVSDFMTMMPGMSYANSAQWGMSSNYGAGQDFFHTTPQPTMATPSIPAPQQHTQSQPAYVAASTPTQMVAPPTQLVHELPIRNLSHVSHSSHTSLAHPEFSQQLPGGPFRPSVWQLHVEPELMHASQLPFKTSIFRNSPFNPAHFRNPDFQPEQWDPAGDYLTAGSSSKSSRHKTDG